MSEATDPPPPADWLPDSVDDLAADGRAKRRRIRLVLFGVIPVVIAGGVALAWVLGAAAAERDIRTAFSRASACLLGAPLGDGERASLRLRAIQLEGVHAELGLPEKTRWPSRCADDLADLQVKLREHGRDDDGEQGLAHRAEQFALQLRKTRIMSDVSSEADGFFEAAQRMGLRAEPVSLSRPTPEPAPSLTLDALPADARISELQYTMDRLSTTPMVDTELHLLIYDQRVGPTPLLCTFTASADDRCRKLGGELVGKDGLRLGGTVAPGAAPLVFAGRDGEGGIYRADTAAKITAMRASSAYVADDGYVAITSRALDPMDGTFELVQQHRPGAELTKTTIMPAQFKPAATQIHRKQVLWDKLLVQVLDADDVEASPRLQYLQLPASNADEPFADIAALNWVNAGIFGCRTPETTIVRIGLQQGFITFFGSEGWTSPVAANSFPPAFSCHKGEAVFTNARGSQQRCTPAGCKYTEGVAPRYAPFKQRDGALADVGGRILSIGLTDGRGGMRYRYGAGKNQADRGTDRLLLDDLVRDGIVQSDSVVLGMRLLGRSDFAVLLLTTPSGLYAVRFDSQGEATPAKITHD